MPRGLGGLGSIMRAVTRASSDQPVPQHLGTLPGPQAVGEMLDLTVLAPAHNEEDNVAALAEQVRAALAPTGLCFEFVVVDDGSTDQTRARLQGLMAGMPWLRCVAMLGTPAGKGHGQSAAFHAGIRAARGRLIATLDADLQNDPADLPAMIERLRSERADMVQGDRSHARRDNAVRRVGSVVGRLFRRWLLGDTIRDTGCSLRVMKREVALRLPLEFRGMHRFIPISAIRMGYRVVQVPVNHRPRIAGETKYGLGITKRAIPGLIDLLAVRWMASRRRPVEASEVRGVEVVTTGSASGEVRESVA
jgi:dolichol-phosphate mannosyltransferase